MDSSQPMVFDKRSKRRKAKDNPYELFTTGTETDHPHYYWLLLTVMESGFFTQGYH